MKIILVVGARPNFIKIAPLITEIKKYSQIKPILLHTGQHYDKGMSKVFFQNLGLSEPDIYLGVGSGSHAQQTAKVIVEFEKVCVKERPDLVVVVGDVNSTLACSLVAAKLQIKIAHVEAGLRSFDRRMPEEINRLVTDSLSDFLFTTCEEANDNLAQEGVLADKIHFVGNVMVDTLLKFKDEARAKAKIKIDKKDYALLTLHRPSNVDQPKMFENILKGLQEISQKIPIIFPAHPRTQKQIKIFGLEKYFSPVAPNSEFLINPVNSINLLEPVSYFEFLNLMAQSNFVLTDSGGIQEETTILGIPCLTLRENTERPITIKEGTNELIGTDTKKIVKSALAVLNNDQPAGKIPKLWDGKAAQRIIKILVENYANRKN